MERKYVPGYYKQGDFVTQRWREATHITVGEVMIDIIFELKHRKLNIKEGNIKIHGRVTEEFNIYKDGGDITQNTDAVAGVFIYLTDMNGDIIEYTFSDNTGAFELSGFDAGDYNLNSDKFGYDSYSKTITTDYKSNYDVETNIVVIKSVSGLDDEYETKGVSVFPQPASNFININYQTNSGTVICNIYNTLGMRISSYISETVPGINHLQINTASLNAGVYYITIEDGYQKTNLIFSISR
jgi:hypothetical protein